MAVTLELIKAIRERTGVGMSKCKEALLETGGDIEKAIEHLRKAGIASAVKKEGRETTEGAITYLQNENGLTLFELSAETDFVVKNDQFQEFLKTLCKQIAHNKPNNLEDLLQTPYTADSKFTVDEKRALIVQAIGENIQPKRFTIIEKDKNQSFGIYSHMGGKIVTVVIISGSDQESELANEIAMHVCAMNPDYITPEEIPSEIIEREREIAKSQLQEKPENIMENILKGKLTAYYKQVCLLYQPFVKDAKTDTQTLLENQSKKKGSSLTIESMLRWSVKG
jgi:elongation factor Ts